MLAYTDILDDESVLVSEKQSESNEKLRKNQEKTKRELNKLENMWLWNLADWNLTLASVKVYETVLHKMWTVDFYTLSLPGTASKNFNFLMNRLIDYWSR